MKAAIRAQSPEDLNGDALELLLEECERAVVQVESRLDEPGRRVTDGDPLDESGEDIAELRLAIAEIVDGHPALSFDLDRIGEKVRAIGPRAGAKALASFPPILDLARLALECYFLEFPTSEAYELGASERELEDAVRSPSETHQALKEILVLLRGRLS